MNAAECFCEISEELCPTHGRDMPMEQRITLMRERKSDYHYLDRAGLERVMDEHVAAKLSAFLRTDTELPHEMREFLADALDKKDDNWHLTWVGAKRGPKLTRARWARRAKKQHEAAVAALRADKQIEQGLPTESAVAEMMESASLTRAEAFEALREYRKNKPYIQRLLDSQS